MAEEEFLWNAPRNSGKRLAAATKRRTTESDDEFFNTTEDQILSDSPTSLSRVIFLQQCWTQVGDVLCEEACVLYCRDGRCVQAVCPVAVIQILNVQKNVVTLTLDNKFKTQKMGFFQSHHTAECVSGCMCVSRSSTSWGQNGRNIRKPGSHCKTVGNGALLTYQYTVQGLCKSSASKP